VQTDALPLGLPQLEGLVVHQDHRVSGRYLLYQLPQRFSLFTKPLRRPVFPSDQVAGIPDFYHLVFQNPNTTLSNKGHGLSGPAVIFVIPGNRIDA